MNIFELLKKQNITPSVEFNRLVALLNYDCFDDGVSRPFRKYINDVWSFLKIRHTSIDIDDLFLSLGIDIRDSSFVDWSKLFLFCELLKNIIVQAKPLLSSNWDIENTIRLINTNLSVILEKTNHKWSRTKKGYIIVKKELAVTEVIESLEDGNENLAQSIMEYNWILLAGNLDRKREILANMANYVEPWKQEMKGSIFYPLYTSSREMTNKLDIRHNNTGKGSIPEYAKNWTKVDFENWYDKIYHTLLMVILSKRQLKIMQEMNKLKKK